MKTELSTAQPNVNGRTKYITKVALLSAIAFILLFLETNIPFMPTFLKIDLSEIPAIIGTVTLGPVAGVIIEFIKNVLHAPMTQTQFIGEIANFVLGSIYVLSIWAIYRGNKDKFDAKKLIKALAFGTLILALSAAIINYLVLLPLYAYVLGFKTSAVVAGAKLVNPMIKNVMSLIVVGIIPFNIIKGIIIGALSFGIFSRVKNYL